jgi:hypothetical protein
MMQTIDVPSRIFGSPLDAETESFIVDCQRSIEAFQDNWDVHRIEQYVAADFRLVTAVLRWIDHTRQANNHRFLEWGCGFAVMATIAASDGWDSVGIESESVLIDQAHKLAHLRPVRPELFLGNFLPKGADDLADDPYHPSLNHPQKPAYDSIGLELDDFGVIYSYPWPGENWFHEAVVDRYGARGVIHIQFAGPNDVRVFQKR